MSLAAERIQEGGPDFPLARSRISRSRRRSTEVRTLCYLADRKLRLSTFILALDRDRFRVIVDGSSAADGKKNTKTKSEDC